MGYATERDALNLAELAELIGSLVPQDGILEPIAGVALTRATLTTELVFNTSKPAFCVIAKGAKEIHQGGRRYRYDAKSYLLATVEMPIKTIIYAPPKDEPYLALRLNLDAALVGSVMMEAGLLPSSGLTETQGLGVSPLDSDLLDAATRLVRLLADPGHAGILVPQIKREIVLRLLTGEQGQRLRHFPAPRGHANRISEALDRLRRDFDRPLRIEKLAEELGMSSTRFHHHFKAITDMSPLQFQKQLRLQEARRLLLNEDLDAATAGYRVGYDDASHFSRDYKRHFGNSPTRDIELMRGVAVTE